MHLNRKTKALNKRREKNLPGPPLKVTAAGENDNDFTLCRGKKILSQQRKDNEPSTF